jgi:hypothetical protein|nr:hypothetical protein [Candidatus Krumholzibacteria bacterium]
MRRLTVQTLILLAGLILLLGAASQALARDKVDTTKSDRHLVIGGHDSHITINTEGSEMTITMTEDGKSKVAVVDMDQIGMLVSDTVSEVAQALSEMQMEFRFGQDNNLSLALADDEWEVDLDAVMAEVADALDGAFEGFDTHDWSHHRHYRTIDRQLDDASEAELEAELDAMRQELGQLKKELARLKEKAQNK